MDVERRRRQRRLRSLWRHEQQTVAAVLAAVTHHSHSKVGTAYDAPRGQKSPAPGWDLPSILNSPRTMAGPPGGSGQRHCSRPGRRGSCCGTPASGSSWSKLSMLLCCRRWNSCRTSCSSLPRSYWWLPSRSSKCRRSCLMMFLCDVPVATRSWWNSWWKYRRPYSTLRYFSGKWSSTSTFQFLLVEGETFVFKVFLPDRVLQRLPEQREQSDRILPASGAEQIAVTPVPGRGISGGLQGLRPGQNSAAFVGGSSQRTAAQIADIPFPSRVSRSFPPEGDSHAFGEADHRVWRSPAFRDDGGFVPGQGSTAPSRDAEEEGEQRMMLLNDRVRAGLPLTSDEYAAWRHWMGLPPKKVTRGAADQGPAPPNLRGRLPPPQCDMSCSVS